MGPATRANGIQDIWEILNDLTSIATGDLVIFLVIPLFDVNDYNGKQCKASFNDFSSSLFFVISTILVLHYLTSMTIKDDIVEQV